MLLFYLFSALGCVSVLVFIVGQILYILDNTYFLKYRNRAIKYKHFTELQLAEMRQKNKEIKELKNKVSAQKYEITKLLKRINRLENDN